MVPTLNVASQLSTYYAMGHTCKSTTGNVWHGPLQSLPVPTNPREHTTRAHVNRILTRHRLPHPAPAPPAIPPRTPPSVVSGCQRALQQSPRVPWLPTVRAGGAATLHYSEYLENSAKDAFLT